MPVRNRPDLPVQHDEAVEDAEDRDQLPERLFTRQTMLCRVEQEFPSKKVFLPESQCVSVRRLVYLRSHPLALGWGKFAVTVAFRLAGSARNAIPSPPRPPRTRGSRGRRIPKFPPASPMALSSSVLPKTRSANRTIPDRSQVVPEPYPFVLQDPFVQETCRERDPTAVVRQGRPESWQILSELRPVESHQDRRRIAPRGAGDRPARGGRFPNLLPREPPPRAPDPNLLACQTARPSFSVRVPSARFGLWTCNRQIVRTKFPGT